MSIAYHPNLFNDVRDFHVKFGLLNFPVPGHVKKKKLEERVEFMQEELDEFKEGARSQDLAQMADALVDLVYVALGTAVQMGLPWDALWNDVQRANMEKVRGMTKRGHAVDVTKPEGWRGPQTDEILAAFGYQRKHWTIGGNPDGHLDEELFRDDA